jgi:hypothetical protein
MTEVNPANVSCRLYTPAIVYALPSLDMKQTW